MSALQEMINLLDLVPVDDSFRETLSNKTNKEVDPKYKYRSKDGVHIYSEDYLLEFHKRKMGARRK